MAFPRKISSLCAPALFYFVVAIIALIWGIWNNLNNHNKIVLGKYSRHFVTPTSRHSRKRSSRITDYT